MEYPVKTRFPPEPNGFLHIGHAKAIYINFMYAKNNNGICYLRFDDTNPKTEKQVYIDSIIEDVKWLGFEPYKITYTSDYFDRLYEYAIKLIENDKCYVCELDSESISNGRKECLDSPYRNRPINESLKLFKEMAEGKHLPGSMVLRMKCDMKSPNPNMRDMVAYRIIFEDHHRTGNKYKVYPSYDFSHPIVDSLEGITHSFCSMEFQTRNELYRWIVNTLDIHKPSQIEYSRLNLTHTVLSKRKLIEMVNDKIVLDWDDPRLPTISGLRRRGYTSDSILDFCGRIGTNFGNSSNPIIDFTILENCIRKDLEDNAPRKMVVINPFKVNIVNLTEIKEVYLKDFPNLGKDSPTRKVNVGHIVYIEKEDFRSENIKGYYRMAPGKIVLLKYFGFIKYSSHTESELFVELLPEDYKPTCAIKGILNWVSEIDHVTVNINEYGYLFSKEISKDWKSSLNIASVKSVEAKSERSILDTKYGNRFQFERVGYYSLDKESKEDRIVLNSIVKLKQDKRK